MKIEKKLNKIEEFFHNNLKVAFNQEDRLWFEELLKS